MSSRRGPDFGCDCQPILGGDSRRRRDSSALVKHLTGPPPDSFVRKRLSEHFASRCRQDTEIIRGTCESVLQNSSYPFSFCSMIKSPGPTVEHPRCGGTRSATGVISLQGHRPSAGVVVGRLGRSTLTSLNSSSPPQMEYVLCDSAATVGSGRKITSMRSPTALRSSADM